MPLVRSVAHGELSSLKVKAYKTMNSIINAYTDGACLGNGTASTRGGWAAVIDDGEQQLRISGHGGQTTNNRMELQAVIEGLRVSEEIGRRPIHVHTDSKYVQKGCTEWLPKWKANGWRTADRKPVKNADLWNLLDELLRRLSPTFHWVRGHNGHLFNELADTLAGFAASSGEGFREVRASGEMSVNMQLR